MLVSRRTSAILAGFVSLVFGLLPGQSHASAVLTLNVDSGQAGASLYLSGSGFTAGSHVSIALDTHVVEIASTSGGAFGTFFTVPALAGGAHTLTVSDGTDSAGTTLRVLAGSLSRTSGAPGVRIALSARGFVGGQTAVVYTSGMGGHTELARGVADTSGSVSLTFNAPLAPYGTHLVTVMDPSDGSALTLPFSTTPSLRALLTGSSLSVQGAGFGSLETVDLTAGGVRLASVTTDNLGRFSASVPLPVSLYISSITASGETSGARTSVPARG